MCKRLFVLKSSKWEMDSLKSYNKTIAQIKTTKEYLNTLNGHIALKSEILPWFNDLCMHLNSTILTITELYREIEGEIINRDTLLLFLNQLITSLSLLINIFVKESELEEILSEARLFAIKQMCWCLNGIEETLAKTSIIDDVSGSFIKWMDAALDKVSEINNGKANQDVKKTCNEAKILFEEVLSHAMSIAQVALEEDCKMIRGSAQTILDDLDSLTKEINKESPNPPMINLFVDICSDKLCALERRVNTAVLKFSLNVFSEYSVALENVDNFCFNRENKGKVEELDSLVVEFDFHVDRIMQIGLFAVSCSTCRNNCIKIRSCLASLEALECELVPAFTAVLINSSVHNNQLASLLKNHWLSQADILQRLIFLIIDPFAFCQVIHEANKQLIDSISSEFRLRHLVNEPMFSKLISQAEVLESFMNVILKELQEQNTEKVKIAFRDFKKMLHEVKSASVILLNSDNRTAGNLRLLKRCKILLSTIKTLWYCFTDGGNENKSSSNNENVSLNNDKSASGDQMATGNLFLDHIMNRGKQILKDRSILYRSPLKNESFTIQTTTKRMLDQLTGQNKSIPFSKLVHLRKLSFMSEVKTDSCGELQITDILNELNNMTNTLGSRNYTAHQ